MIKTSAGPRGRIRAYKGLDLVLIDCNTCDELLPLDNFRKNGRGGQKATCKKCEFNDEKKKERNRIRAKSIREKDCFPQKVYTANTNASYRNAKGKLKVAEFKEIVNRFNGCCCYCEKKLDLSYHGDLNPDHFIPLSKGGINTGSNIVPACETCNKDKRQRDPFMWMYKTFGYAKQLELVNYFKEHYQIDYSNKITN